jgi:hypothetical protein
VKSTSCCRSSKIILRVVVEPPNPGLRRGPAGASGRPRARHSHEELWKPCHWGERRPVASLHGRMRHAAKPQRRWATRHVSRALMVRYRNVCDRRPAVRCPGRVDWEMPARPCRRREIAGRARLRLTDMFGAGEADPIRADSIGAR